MSPCGLILAAPASGSGKTVAALSILRALSDMGVDLRAAKAGPDYIDPAFHALACGAPSVNLDPWAMQPDRLRGLALSQGGSHLLVEAMMGLFDGAADGSGSTADLASVLGLPVALVVDCARQSHSVAALVRGFRDHRADIQVAGVILNRVGSPRHEAMLVAALAAIEMPVFGAIPRHDAMQIPERHLGLVQAGEHADIKGFIASAAAVASSCVDLERLLGAFAPVSMPAAPMRRLPPPGQRIAIACDTAFAFAYPHQIFDWRATGAEISFFSPLVDEEPDAAADSVFLPGGYPELHAGSIASAGRFLGGLRRAAARGAFIYGECGGYMVLGHGLVDREGHRHAMSGLLPLETSFEKPRLHLGYRHAVAAQGFPLGSRLRAHEFHYSQALSEKGEPLFTATDALGAELGGAGLRSGNVMGSYFHVVDAA
jgi:cobyrinic acid a,c-diamide synthase